MNSLVMRTVIMATLSLGLVVSFQNCAKEVQVDKYTDSSAASSGAGGDNGSLFDPPSVQTPSTQEPLAPVVTSPIQDTYLSIQYNNGVVMSVNGTGEGAISYQWYKNNDPISGAIQKDYVIGNTVEGNGGDYKAMVTSGNGLWVYSPTFHLSIIRLDSQYAPNVAINPGNLTVNYDSCFWTVNDSYFTAQITNLPVTGTYSWFRHLNGKAEEKLTETSNKLKVSAFSDGTYRVEVKNAYGTGSATATYKTNYVWSNCGA